MAPHKVVALPSLPRNPNGKIDRKQLAGEFSRIFEESGS
jgi:acyl-coenzyme A synthetase/AMP-(fatty) acid ligase